MHQTQNSAPPVSAPEVYDCVSLREFVCKCHSAAQAVAQASAEAWLPKINAQKRIILKVVYICMWIDAC